MTNNCKETKNLYLSNSTFNRNRIIERLAVVVENHGGKVKYTKDNNVDIVINSRGFSEKIMRQEEKVNFWKRNLVAVSDDRKEAMQKAIKNAIKELEQLKEAEKNALHYVSNFCGKYSWGLPSLHFVLDGVYYVFSFDDNPFCVDHYQKIRLNENNEYFGKYYMECLTNDEKEPKDYIFDSLFECVSDADDIKEMSEIIFNKLVSAPFSKRYHERKKIRVNNIFDGGFHYEYKYSADDNKKTVISF